MTTASTRNRGKVWALAQRGLSELTGPTVLAPAVATSILLIRLPVALGYAQSVYVRSLFLLPVALALWLAALRMLLRAKLSLDKRILPLVFVCAGLMVFSFLRTAADGRLGLSLVLGNLAIWLVAAGLAICAFGSSGSKAGNLRMRSAVYHSLLVYVAGNILLHAVGFTSPQLLFYRPFRSTLLGLMGIEASRLLFPTTSGHTNFGALGGALFSASCVVLMRQRSLAKRALVELIGIGLGFSAILLTDSRAALVAAIATVCLVGFIQRRYLRHLQWLPLTAPVLPLLAIAATSMAPHWLSAAVDRSGASLANLSNRASIWASVLDELAQFRAAHVFGFGYRGQVISGLASTYSEYFVSFAKGDLASAHNAVLQTVVEEGYAGLVVTMALLGATMGRAAGHLMRPSREERPWALLAILTFLVLVGTTEPAWSPDYQELQMVMLYAIAAVASLSDHTPAGRGDGKEFALASGTSQMDRRRLDLTE